MSLEQILDKRQDIWWGKAVSPAIANGVPTGFAALAADLRILHRKPDAERATLERSLQLPSQPEDTQALVLEAARSLRLFGGAEALLEQVAKG